MARFWEARGMVGLIILATAGELGHPFAAVAGLVVTVDYVLARYVRSRAAR